MEAQQVRQVVSVSHDCLFRKPDPTIFITLMSEEDLPGETVLKLKTYASRLRDAAKKLDEVAALCDNKTYVSLPQPPVRIVLSAPADAIKKFEKDPSKIIPCLDFQEDDGEE